MQDEQITELCGKIYSQHRKAIDLIIANKPDRRDFVAFQVKKLIKAAKLIDDDSSRAYIRFTSDAFASPFLTGSIEWTESKRLVLYEFRNEINGLSLIVQLGRGDQSKRALILKTTHDFGAPFKPEKKLYTKWNRLYKFDILDENDYELSDKEITKKVEEKWQEFLKTDFPKIEHAFKSHSWPITPAD